MVNYGAAVDNLHLDCGTVGGCMGVYNGEAERQKASHGWSIGWNAFGSRDARLMLSPDGVMKS